MDSGYSASHRSCETTILIIALFTADLVLAAVRPHRVSLGEASAWSLFYIAVAMAFGAWFSLRYGSEFGAEFFAGYVVEKSLSVDNLFVFVVIMSTFAVPEQHQHKVLTIGIILALGLRVVLIVVGATLLALFSVMFLLFGLLLIYTAVQLVRHRNQDPDIEGNRLVKAARRMLPISTEYVGGKLSTRVGGHRVFTPLVLVLVAIAGFDLLFALDSIPAVFGVTGQPYIVYVANAFALLGLRALFFLIKGLLDRLVYLAVGLSAILGFIGVKLVLHWAHVDIDQRIPQIPIALSLAVIVTVLAAVTVASLIKTRLHPSASLPAWRS